jgi:hypothetical protein
MEFSWGRRGENELNGEKIEVWLFVVGAAAGTAP